MLLEAWEKNIIVEEKGKKRNVCNSLGNKLLPKERGKEGYNRYNFMENIYN